MKKYFVKSKITLIKRSRRIKRFFRKPKFLKLQKKIIQLYKYSAIYSVARSENPENLLTRDEKQKLIELFQLCLHFAWVFFKKLKGLLIKIFNKFTMPLLKLFRNHPWVTAYLTFASCALLIYYRLARKFGRKLRFYEYLLVTILSLIIIGLFAKLIQMEAFKTIGEWFKSFLLTLLLVFKNLTRFLYNLFNKHKNKLEPNTDLKPSEPSNASNAGDFQKLVVFSLLTVFTTRFLLLKFKRKLVGYSPFTDIIIDIVDFVPDDPPVKKLFNLPQPIRIRD